MPHQANKRIIESMAKKLNMPMEKLFVLLTVMLIRRGISSSSATEGVSDGRIVDGDLVLFEAIEVA